MKNFGFTVNIDNNSNAIIGHSEAEWKHIRNNSLISIDNEPTFYTIGRVEPLNFIADFIVSNNNLVIPGNHEHYFIYDDILTISYKEYELLAILEVVNKGANYHQGDILSLDGGIVSMNIVDNTSHATLLRVEEVSADGQINKLSVIHKGIYLQFPNKVNKLKGGHGQGAEISVESSLINDRKMIERQVIAAENEEAVTKIQINFPLPASVTQGKVSVSKYIGYLTSTYVGPTKRDVPYNITRDFSPVLGLPLLVKGSNKIEETFNYTILKLEQKIRELESKITSL